MLEKILICIIQVCTFLCYIPQIIKTLRLKKSADVAISSWVISFVSAVAYLVYGFMKSDSFIIITCATEFVLALISIIVLIKYRNSV